MEKNVFEELRAGKPYHILDPDYVEQVHSEMKRCRHIPSVIQDCSAPIRICYRRGGDTWSR